MKAVSAVLFRLTLIALPLATPVKAETNDAAKLRVDAAALFLPMLFGHNPYLTGVMIEVLRMAALASAWNIIGGIGPLGLPIAAAIMLLLRRRGRQALDSFIAMLVAVVILTALSSGIVALHDLALAARYCDRLCLLHGGRVQAAGTPAEVLTEANLQAVFGVEVKVDLDVHPPIVSLR